MDANDRLTTQQKQAQHSSTDQETDLSPPGGITSGTGSGSGTEGQRQAGWQRQQGQQNATALKEQQDADLNAVKGVAGIDDPRGLNDAGKGGKVGSAGDESMQ